MSNDVIMDVLKSRGYVGHYNDALSSWAKDELGETGHINKLLDRIAEREGVSNSMELVDKFEKIFGKVNLIVNGDFPVNTGNWDLNTGVTLTWDNGRVKFEQDTGYRAAYQTLTVKPGSTYKASAQVENGSITGVVRVRDGYTSDTVALLKDSIPSETFVATSDKLSVQMRGEAGAGFVYFDNLEVVEV